MKRCELLSILIACSFLLSGCSTGSKYTNDKELPKEDHATEITIEVRDYNTNFYATAATKFEKETGVKVNVINDFKGESSEDLHVNVERIEAELMAGKGADIYANTYLDYASIGENKHLCNLANWIAEEPEFSDDVYYMNILKSGFAKGDMYSVPLFMNFLALGSNIEVPELDGKSLGWEEFFAFAKGIKRNGVLYGITDQMLFDRRFLDRYALFINKKEKTQYLNSTDMIKLLEQCKKWSSEGLCIPYNAENFTELWDKSFFKEPGGSNMDMLVNFRFDIPYETNKFYYYDIPSDCEKKDNANKIMPTDIICINGATPYKATAWKFVKFLLSEDIQATGFGTPINRIAADKQINKNLKEIISYYGLDADAEKIIKESEAILDGVEQASANTRPTDIEKIVLKESKRFFKNEISADAAAKNMADRVSLYFKEQ